MVSPIDPDTVEYGSATLDVGDGIGNNKAITVEAQDNNGNTDHSYPENHYAGTSVTFEVTSITDNQGTEDATFGLAIVRDDTDAGDSTGNGHGDYLTSQTEVEDYTEMGGLDNISVGNTFTMTLGAPAGTYRAVITVGAGDANEDQEIDNVSTTDTSTEYHFDCDGNNANGGAAALTQINTKRVAWLGRRAVVDSLTSSTTNHGYTDQPTISVTLDAKNSDTSGVQNPQQVKLIPAQTDNTRPKGALDTSVGSGGSATSASYNVDTQWPQSAVDLDIEVAVNDGAVDSSTPSNERPGLAASAPVNGLSSNQLSWVVFDGTGHFTNANVFDTSTTADTTDIADGVENPATNTGNQIGHDIDISTLSFNASTTAPSGTTLYNRGEEVNMDIEWDDVFGSRIDPDSTTYDVHDTNHNTEASSTSQNSGPYSLTYTIASDDEAAFDTTGADKHIQGNFAHYGSNDPTFDFTGTSEYPSGDLPFQVSRKLLLGSSSNSRAVGTDNELYNRNEVVNLTADVFYARGTVYENNDGTSRTGITGRVQDGNPQTAGTDPGTPPSDGDTIEDEQTTLRTIGGGDPTLEQSDGTTYEYTIGSSDAATNDLTGQPKHLRIVHQGNATDDSDQEWDVSRKWQMSTDGTGTITSPNKVFTAKSSSPTSDAVTAFNRGQDVFFNCYIYNARSELLGSPTVHFNARDIGDETMDDADQTLSLSSGQFTGSNATYTIDTDEATGDKALVVSSATTSSSNQPVSGTGGTGNFAESLRTSTDAEYNVSDTYNVNCRLQKEATRNTDAEDTKFTISADVEYVYARVTDQNGDPVNNVDIIMEHFDPNDVESEQSTGTTGSDGWTPAKSVTVDAPADSDWDTTAEVDGTHLGNDGSDNQVHTHLSAFTADKVANIGLGPADGVANTNGERTPDAGDHARPGDRLIVGFGVLEDGQRIAVDTAFTPRFMIARFDEGTNAVEVLQPDDSGSYAFYSKDETTAGGNSADAEHWFDFKVGVEPVGGSGSDYLEYLSSFGTSGQGVDSTNGYVVDTATFPEGRLFVMINYKITTQPFYNSDTALFGNIERGDVKNIDVFDGTDFATGFPSK